VSWQDERPPQDRTPLTVAEAAGAWRRVLASRSASPARRLAALDGLLALGDDPGRWWFQRDWTGTDRPLHEHLRVSYSKLDRLDNCELQFVLGEELGLEGRSGFYAWVGHLVHRIIEDCENGLVERSTEALVAAAEERWQPEQFPSFAVSEAFRRLVTRTVLPAWMKEYGGTEALAKEIGFEFEFAGAVVRGYIDRIGAAGNGSQITDYKTGKARNAAKADENLQLGMYYLAVQHAEALAEYRPVKAVELAFLRDTTYGAMSRAAMSFTRENEPGYLQEMTERLTALIERLAGLYRDEVYRPNPAANCRICDFKQLCPLWPEGGEVFPVRTRVEVPPQ
jgi:RecB family exonuclease